MFFKVLIWRQNGAAHVITSKTAKKTAAITSLEANETQRRYRGTYLEFQKKEERYDVLKAKR